MYETPDDLAALQQLLDESWDAGGRHLKEVITPDRRVRASELASRLDGMRLLVVATVSRAGRPLCGPVDGIFYRGAFHFGTSPDSVRAGHLRIAPFISATHLPSERFAVTVHGNAVSVDTTPAGALREVLLEVYEPRYGPGWSEFLDSGPVYFRIDAWRMFSFSLVG
jgi:hypothetical protein